MDANRADSQENQADKSKSGDKGAMPHTGITTLGTAAEAFLLERYGPASVLIDRNLDVWYFYGNTKRFLNFPNGDPTRNLSDLCPRGLQLKLRTVVRKVATPPVGIRVGIEMKLEFRGSHRRAMLRNVGYR